MKVEERDGNILLSDIDFDIKHTFDCGQCFRFYPYNNGYLGVAHGKPLYLENNDSGILISSTTEDFNALWKDFFDLDTDYEAIAQLLPEDDFTTAAITFGKGLRLLRQEPWEALCSFIISQCNNIPRIQSIIDRLCTLFGNEIMWQGKKLYTFPTAEVIAQLSVEDLAPLRCGYRAPYIISAARAVAGGKVNFEAMKAMNIAAARKEIMSLDGVGPKVADCFLLFGLHKLDAFPVDTWMKKAAVYYGGKFDAKAFGDYAGIAQQYIFYYARSGLGI